MTPSAPAAADAERARSVVASVPDPEVPVLTIDDLGVLRGVEVTDGRVKVTITPTYSGCPAVEAIRHDIETALHDIGYGEVRVETVLSPAWTTDWISERGRQRLLDYGIAPPPLRRPVPLRLSVRCPQCGSGDTREVSRFGSTACKALWACNACLEPFDHFKVL